MRISAVIPVLDEEPTLRELHVRLAEVLAALTPDFEVIFVNDGSADGSLGVLREIAERDPRVAAVDLRRRFGKAAALAAGFAEARGDVIVTIDADLQDVPEEIPKLVERIRAGADLVTGRKRERRDPWTRRFASFIFNRAVSWTMGAPFHDINSGLKAIRREVVAEIPLHGELHRFLPVLARGRGFAVEEVDVAHNARRHGRSRYGWGRYAAGVLDPITVLLLTRFGKRPLHFFGIIGGLLAAAGAAILVYLASAWFFGRWIGNRPLLTLGVLLVILGIQSLFFGVLAELIVVAGGNRDRGYSVREVIRAAKQPAGAARPASDRGSSSEVAAEPAAAGDVRG